MNGAIRSHSIRKDLLDSNSSFAEHFHSLVMQGSKFYIDIWFFLLVGLTVRLAYSFQFTPWLLAPDQLASEFLLDEIILNGTWRYDNLIHYPHEGGSILLSLLALVPKWLGSSYGLHITAVVVSSISTALQLLIIRRLFTYSTFILFGLWTIFAWPGIIPWTTLTYGLHHVSALFPFLMLAMCSDRFPVSGKPVLHGIALGLFIWFSYTNVVLVIPYFIWLLKTHPNLRHVLKTIGGLAGILALHMLVRSISDPGFQLLSHGASTIRGLGYDYLNDPATYHRLYEVWIQSLPGSSMLPAIFGLSMETIRSIWNWINLLGLLGLLLLAFKQQLRSPAMLATGAAIAFVLFYSLSPLYELRIDREVYVYFRHFTYILPVFTLAVLIGLNAVQAQLRYAVVAGYLALGAIGYVTMMGQPTVSATATRAAGWVLGHKLGHHPERLARLASQHPDERDELLTGIGWGITAALFADADTANKQQDDLCNLIQSFDENDRQFVLQGVAFAFSDKVTPVLNPAFKPMAEACR